MRANPDTLKIPAFKRKSRIKKKAEKPLLLTALDRKKAGVKIGVPVKKKRKRRVAAKRTTSRTMTERLAPGAVRRRTPRSTLAGRTTSAPARRVTAATRARRATTARRATSVSSVPSTGFDEPLLDMMLDEPVVASVASVAPEFDDGQEFLYIGRMTHYYDGINVGVIDLEKPLRVGDYLMFETENGLCGQQVESMQYNKRDISMGRTGMEVGLKLAAAPVLRGKVFKV